MKFNNIFKYAAVAVAAGSLLGVASCNYLDVVPPEQPNLVDAMKTHDNALGFLYSCYVGTTAIAPAEYTSPFSSTTDEYVWPNEQESAYPSCFAVLKNTQTTDGSNIQWLWGTMYQYIGQCLLFEKELLSTGRDYEVTRNEEEENLWLAESRFLKAYYHMEMLRLYGPIPLTMELIDMDAPDEDFPGRSHFDYCVRYLANEFDEAAKVLPETWDNANFGRATKVIAKAMKARLLLLAASDLFNGKFPYPEWRNVNYETPGYGKELVSNTYDRQKWEDAFKATSEAIELAEKYHRLFDDAEYEAVKEENVVGSNGYSNMDWIPVDFTDDTEKLAFINKVMLNRYLHTTSQSENPEILWSRRYTYSNLEAARFPLKINKNSNGQWYTYAWSVVNPTLNTVYNFLCKDGRLPADSHPDIDFSPRSEWFQAITPSVTGHEDMINLVRNREPRFYAWIAFDGGNYLNRIKNGEPLTLNFKTNKDGGQGADFTNEPKNLASTGFLAMKHVAPVYSIDNQLTAQPGTSHPVVLMRLTELYLNLAECAAELANPKRAGADAQYAATAIEYINRIRKRAGVPELTESEIGVTFNNPITNTSKQMTLVEWVRQERFIELWDEGQRYYDVRRWVAGSEYFAAGMRQGLTGDIENCTFEEFNTPRVCNPTFTFGTRQYLYPLFINEVYKNPQMVQAPGY